MRLLEASKEESLEVIQEAIDRKEAGRIDRVVVAGCLVQRHRARLLEWVPGIDAMIASSSGSPCGVVMRWRLR